MHDLLIDLANICRDSQLGGHGQADWSRLDRLLEAWCTQVNPYSRVLLVADQALARDFRTQDDRARWRRLENAGDLLAVPDADIELLRRARMSGASILSRDGFIGHRREHDWIQGDAEHFWRWQVGADGAINITLVRMATAGDYTMTRAAERDAFKAAGYHTTDLRHGALAEVYRCVNPACAASADDLLRDLPRRIADHLVCPHCRRPLVSRGPRPAARRLRLMYGSDEVDTLRLGDGQQVVLGRGAGPAKWNVDDAVDFSTRISRDHARLSLRGGLVVVEDLGSTNGTCVARWDPARHGWLCPERVDSPVTLLARDRVVLPDDLVIVQSGQRYVVPDVL